MTLFKVTSPVRVFFQGKVAKPMNWHPTSAETLETVVGVETATYARRFPACTYCDQGGFPVNPRPTFETRPILPF